MISRRAKLVSIVAGLLAAGAVTADDDVRQYTFSWLFTDDAAMKPRGGTTTGPEVELLEGTSEAWEALREPSLSDFERDRRAILAMAGHYRTTFDFIETTGFTEDYGPSRPYQSWATEYVFVLEDSEDVISLQHVIVMQFVEPDGTIRGPVVQKHWRQEWRYEDRDLHTYVGDGRWRRRMLSEDDVEGKWSQAVYNVDDSPRYEAIGDWVHRANYSAWTSEETWRPLPRRESSVRDDYDVLIGTNRHTITPTGWVQEEDNLKVDLGPDGSPAEVLAREVGVSRYERIVDFDFSAGEEYWQSTSAFWSDVRDAWRDVYRQSDTFRLADEVDGQPLFARMFDYAQALNDGEPYDPEASRRFVRDMLERYLTE
ncbi:MAG TPA: DUF6607 family protein [Gammaproteobacteria bacterium]